MQLAPGGAGPRLAERLLENGEILEVSRAIVQPFYQRKAMSALDQLQTRLDGLPYRIHRPEGAIFLWLWLEGLPCGSAGLYERLKARNTLVVPGHHFFPGLEQDPWAHKQECIRITYAQDDALVERGIDAIADEVRKVYG